MFREEAASALAGSPSILLELEFGVFFGEGGNPESPEENP